VAKPGVPFNYQANALTTWLCCTWDLSITRPDALTIWLCWHTHYTHTHTHTHTLHTTLQHTHTLTTYVCAHIHTQHTHYTHITYTHYTHTRTTNTHTTTHTQHTTHMIHYKILVLPYCIMGNYCSMHISRLCAFVVLISRLLPGPFSRYTWCKDLCSNHRIWIVWEFYRCLRCNCTK